MSPAARAKSPLFSIIRAVHFYVRYRTLELNRRTKHQKYVSFCLILRDHLDLDIEHTRAESNDRNVSLSTPALSIRRRTLVGRYDTFRRWKSVPN